MISKTPQPIEIIGDPGGNRTRDNLIKSPALWLYNQCFIAINYVKPSTAHQYVTNILSNLFASYNKVNISQFKPACLCFLLGVIMQDKNMQKDDEQYLENNWRVRPRKLKSPVKKWNISWKANMDRRKEREE